MKRRVYHLAAEVGLEPDVALEQLRDAGFSLPDSNSQVKRRYIERALAVLREERARHSPPAQPFIPPGDEGSAAHELEEIAHTRIKKDRGQDVRRLSVGEVLAIRRQMARSLIAEKDAFGNTEPLWPDKLEMAVNRQFTSGGGIFKYKTPYQVGATLAYGLTLSHAFENGNKRTALVALLVFLNRNRLLLVEVTEDELYELMKSLANHDIRIPDGVRRDSDQEVASLAGWLKDRTRELELGEQSMSFREFRRLLVAQGCEFDSPKGNFIKIRREGKTVKTGYPRESFVVSVTEIKKIRRALHLDEIHGFDSQGFYNMDGAVDKFVNHYRNLMRRLADL